MKLLMYGVSQETVTKEEANKYKLANGRKERQMAEILEFDGIEEIVILDSEFRNEYYLYVDELIFSHGEFLRYLSVETGKNLEEIILETYSKFNEDVLRHLYEIASGYLSNPIGAFGILLSLENSLNLAKELDTAGNILNKMFKEAVQLAYSLKLNELVRPLNLSKMSRYIYSLKNKLGQLKNKNYILAADDEELIVLSETLLAAEAQSITITHCNNQELNNQYKEIKNRLSEIDQNKIYMADSKALNYRLSKADAVILNLDEFNILDKNNREEVAEIRQTRKIQYVIDLSENPVEKINCEALDIEILKPKLNEDYDEEEQQQAIVEFENILSEKIKKFMKYFTDLQEQKLTEITC
ncbi:MAG: hypothetical protein L0L04_07285 [Staphylococcus equorum]|nr:hypothetical protein [Staphylococcus equorum]